MNIKRQKELVNQLAEWATEKAPYEWESLGNINYSYRPGEDLVQLSYSSVAGRKSPWNEYEQVCRGLILSTKEKRVVAWPFEKFFNIGEGGRKPQGHIKTITKKFDGSLGIMYWSNADDPCIATRGSFTSPHAHYATYLLKENHFDKLIRYAPRNLTFLFEIIAPEFRNVIDYGGASKLVLLAARRTSGVDAGKYIKHYPNLYGLADLLGLEITPTVNFHSLEEVIKASGTLPGSEEGWVIEMSNGERWKVKGDEYVELHRIVNNISLKKALDYLTGDPHAAQIIDTVFLPEEYEDRWEYYLDMLNDQYHQIFFKARELFSESPNGDRKTFAKWATTGKRKHYSGMLFKLYDNARVHELDRVAERMLKNMYKNGELDWIEEDYNKHAKEGVDKS